MRPSTGGESRPCITPSVHGAPGSRAIGVGFQDPLGLGEVGRRVDVHGPGHVANDIAGRAVVLELASSASTPRVGTMQA